MLSKYELDEYYENCSNVALTSLWYSLSQHYSYKKARQLFFYIISNFIKNNKLRLAENTSFLDNNAIHLKSKTQDVLKKFKDSLPNEGLMKEIGSYWFYMEDCPYRPVWITDFYSDGFSTSAPNGMYYFWS